MSERAAAASDDRVVVGEERASPLELFFDLVFVFALTQVARVIAADPSFGGFARAAVLLAALWYAWICFAWLTNSVDLEDTIERVGVLLGAGASFLVALAVPAALSEDVWLFVGAYFALRVLHVASTPMDFGMTATRVPPSSVSRPLSSSARPCSLRCRGSQKTGGSSSWSRRSPWT